MLETDSITGDTEVDNTGALAIGGMICLGLGFVGILVLISDVVVGGAAPAVVGALSLALVAGLWFVLPLARRERE